MAGTRSAPRYRVAKAGTIEFAGERINCVVRDLSNTGAAIDVDNPTCLPTSILLVLPDDELRLGCDIVWRKQFRIGVRFH